MTNPDVDALFTEFITATAPGAAVLVAKSGQIVHQAGYGLANLTTRTRNTPQTIFHMASAGKQFTGLAIMLLAEAGRLAYDDPVAKHLPQLQKRFGKAITLRRLLHHTSGLTDYYGDEALTERFPTPTNADILTYLAEIGSLDFVPGQKYEYSNPGYDVLGAVVEQVSGQTFDAFLQTRVFKPLGMKNSFSYNPARLSDPTRALGYDVEGETFTLYDSDPLDQIVGSGSVFSTVADLFLYDQALYTEKLVKQKTLAEALKPAELNDGTHEPYGFGWEVDEYYDYPYMAHSGSWVGFLSYMVRIPKQKLSVFILSNRTDTETEGLAFQIVDMYWE